MPYVGEIRMFAGDFAPAGWLFCDGQQLPISENEALFSLIGTTYGGDGDNTFAAPDLRGRAPVHVGTLANRSFKLADTGGQESVRLTVANLPSHSHPVKAILQPATTNAPERALLADTGKSGANAYGTGNPIESLSPSTVGTAGASAPHDNVQPFLAVNFIISMVGTMPFGRGGADGPYVGEIRIFPYNFVPRGWAPCNGQLLPTSGNTALFSILKTYYGGNGQSSFGLPNLVASVPVGAGHGNGLSDRPLGGSGGERAVQLTREALAVHGHRLMASTPPGNKVGPEAQYAASAPNLGMYGAPENLTQMSTDVLQPAGNGSPHNNMQPYLALTFGIALQGMFPPRS
jgi:microcystin-dependent protein